MAFGRKPRMRLFDFIPIYIECYLKIKDARSLSTELGRVRKIKEHFGDVLVDAIDTLAIEGFLAELSRTGRQPATVNRYHARISSMMRRAMVWGYRDDNPAERIERLKEPTLGDRYLEPEEFHQLIAACHPEIRPLVLIAAQTGMRRGELMSLRWDDINWQGRCLIVRAQNSKTGEGRIVPLNAGVMRTLNNLDRHESGYVLPFEHFPRYRWEQARRKLGWDRTDNPRLRDWRFHDLRHLAGSLMVMADVPLSKIAKILGHKQLITTQRYAHLADRSLFEAVEKIGAVLSASDDGDAEPDVRNVPRQVLTPRNKTDS